MRTTRTWRLVVVGSSRYPGNGSVAVTLSIAGLAAWLFAVVFLNAVAAVVNCFGNTLTSRSRPHALRAGQLFRRPFCALASPIVCAKRPTPKLPLNFALRKP